MAQSAHFRQVAGNRVQQGRIGLEEVGSQEVIPYVLDVFHLFREWRHGVTAFVSNPG
jgi:hypothetical protein